MRLAGYDCRVGVAVIAEVLSWVGILAKPLSALIESIFDDDDEAERQALLDIQRTIHDEKARRKFGAP